MLTASDGFVQLYSTGVCRNTNGSFVCGCPRGYVCDNAQCQDINECVLIPGPQTCGNGSSCTNTPGSYLCVCSQGYQFKDGACVDQNECTSNAHNCSAFGVCENQVGSFKCHCGDGYHGDGVTCGKTRCGLCSANVKKVSFLCRFLYEAFEAFNCASISKWHFCAIVFISSYPNTFKVVFSSSGRLHFLFEKSNCYLRREEPPSGISSSDFFFVLSTAPCSGRKYSPNSVECFDCPSQCQGIGKAGCLPPNGTCQCLPGHQGPDCLECTSPRVFTRDNQCTGNKYWFLKKLHLVSLDARRKKNPFSHQRRD